MQNIFKHKYIFIYQTSELKIRYPENNLFTLKRLIPIEDLERLPVKAIAFFMSLLFLLYIM